MRILKIIVIILVALVLVFFAGGFLIPDEWVVSKSMSMQAKPNQIYPYVASFKEWERWSPWNSSKDPSLKYIYEGPSIGQGSKQSWTSKQMGKGWMQLTAADPEKGVSYDLFIDMGRSQSTLHGTIAFTQDDKTDSTRVTWTDKGNSGNNYLHRWMSILLKSILGKEMNTGLTSLKAIVENKQG